MESPGADAVPEAAEPAVEAEVGAQHAQEAEPAKRGRRTKLEMAEHSLQVSREKVAKKLEIHNALLNKVGSPMVGSEREKQILVSAKKLPGSLLASQISITN